MYAFARPHTSIEMAENLRTYVAPEVGSRGITEIVRLLPRERSLIFMVSDFHMPIADLEESLVLMQRHHIVPIVLWDSSEYSDLPEFGIANVTDPETGASRTLFYANPIASAFCKALLIDVNPLRIYFCVMTCSHFLSKTTLTQTIYPNIFTNMLQPKLMSNSMQTRILIAISALLSLIAQPVLADVIFAGYRPKICDFARRKSHP